jgi:hypothetical protein
MVETFINPTKNKAIESKINKANQTAEYYGTPKILNNKITIASLSYNLLETKLVYAQLTSLLSFFQSEILKQNSSQKVDTLIEIIKNLDVLAKNWNADNKSELKLTSIYRSLNVLLKLRKGYTQLFVQNQNFKKYIKLLDKEFMEKALFDEVNYILTDLKNLLVSKDLAALLQHKTNLEDNLSSVKWYGESLILLKKINFKKEIPTEASSLIFNIISYIDDEKELSSYNQRLKLNYIHLVSYLYNQNQKSFRLEEITINIDLFNNGKLFNLSQFEYYKSGQNFYLLPGVYEQIKTLLEKGQLQFPTKFFAFRDLGEGNSDLKFIPQQDFNV